MCPMDKQSQIVFENIINKLQKKVILTPYDASFLRARRSYLSLRQKIQYGDTLYLNRQFLFHKIINLISFISKYIKEIIITLIASLIIKLLGL